jgi:hypothetical protein
MPHGILRKNRFKFDMDRTVNFFAARNKQIDL